MKLKASKRNYTTVETNPVFLLAAIYKRPSFLLLPDQFGPEKIRRDKSNSLALCKNSANR